MLNLGNALRAGSIGTTAIMMLIAGLPQFVCACPGKSGQAIPPPKGLVLRGCSCGGSCCASSSPEGHQKPCCQRGHRNPPAPTGSPAWRTTCKVSVAASDFVSPSPAKVWSPDIAPPLTLTILATQANSSSSSWSYVAWRLPHHTPPPDLVTLLQRFLI